MGDRGNIVVCEQDGGRVYLYSHWGGYELPETVAAALVNGEDRWDDEAYLARILFCELVKDDMGGTTGYGISTAQGDSGTEVYVYPGQNKVVFKDDEYTFEGFVEKFHAS